MSEDSARLHAVTITLGAKEGCIEEILPAEEGQACIRIFSLAQGGAPAGPLEVTESELVDLLQKAIRAGILPPEFLDHLHAEFEI